MLPLRPYVDTAQTRCYVLREMSFPPVEHPEREKIVMKKNTAGWWQIAIEASISTYHDDWGYPEAKEYGLELRNRFDHLLRLDPATAVPRNWPEAQKALRWIEADAMGESEDTESSSQW